DAVIAAQYRALVDSVKSQSPQTKIFVQSILPLNPTVKNFPQHYDKQERVVAVNVLIRRMARETGATYVDLWPIFVDRQNRLDAAPFTYDDVPAGQTDPTLAAFTIDAARADLIPVLKRILALNPGIELLATPWTAPRWMKDNGAYVGGSLRPANYAAYAQYFV